MTSLSTSRDEALRLLEQAYAKLLTAGEERSAGFAQKAIQELSQDRDTGMRPEELNSANDD